jgi:hypothetical protein
MRNTLPKSGTFLLGHPNLYIFKIIPAVKYLITICNSRLNMWLHKVTNPPPQKAINSMINFVKHHWCSNYVLAIIIFISVLNLLYPFVFIYYICQYITDYMTHGKWPTWCTVLFYVSISILYMFWATLCSSSGESIVINTISGTCHSVSVTVSCAGRKRTVPIWPAYETVTDTEWHVPEFVLIRIDSADDEQRVARKM